MKKYYQIKFSVIVPVFNVEKYLKQCIESVLVQSFQDYELILIDDGSTDMSGQICDGYAGDNCRIKTIHKTNGGLSSARNAGLDVARGEYVLFLDSDDYWDDRYALENINSSLSESNADVLLFMAKRFYEDKHEFTKILNMDVDRSIITDSNVEKSIRYMIQNNIYRASACNKVIQKKLIDMNEMHFRNGYLSEDMEWCADLLLYASKFDFYDSPFYIYRQQRLGSITKNKTEKLVTDKLYMIDNGFRKAQKCQSKTNAELLRSYYAYEYSVTLGVSSKIKSEKLLNQMKLMSNILRYDISDKVKKVNHLKKLLGYGLTRKALCVFVRIKR